MGGDVCTSSLLARAADVLCAICLLGVKVAWFKMLLYYTTHLLAASYLKSSPQVEPCVHPLGAGLPPVWEDLDSPCLSDFSSRLGTSVPLCCPTSTWPAPRTLRLFGRLSIITVFGAGALHLYPQALQERRKGSRNHACKGVAVKACTSVLPAKMLCLPPASCLSFPSQWPPLRDLGERTEGLLSWRWPQC